MNSAAGPAAGPIGPKRIPTWVKVLYTTFLCVLVPCYWNSYGPTNFLFLCDVALFMTLVALWRESSLWACMPAAGILLPQAIWMVDVLGGVLGIHVLGLTAYLFSPTIPLFTRVLSLFHFWLPLFLLWIIGRLGYDRRAFAAWTVLATVLMVVCYCFLPAPPAPPDSPNLPVNINYVYGLSEERPQESVPPLVYLAALLVVTPLCIVLPAHLLLRRVFRAAVFSPSPESGSQSQAGR